VTLRARWLGRVPYREALDLQTALFEQGQEDHLLLLEHPHVFTYGARADLGTNVLVDPASVGADLVAVNRGGDVTYHGPGQLVGYPIVTLRPKWGSGSTGLADSVAYVRSVEQLVIDTLTALGLPDVGRLREYPGVWVSPEGPNPRKICAIGVRLTRGRTMHGFALNVAPDLRFMREYIIPCGIADRPVTSLAEEGIVAGIQDVVDILVPLAAQRWGDGGVERQDVAWKHDRTGMDLSPFSRGEGPGELVRDADGHLQPSPTGPASEPVRLMGRLARAGVGQGLAVKERKPEWLRPKVRLGTEVLAVKSVVKDLGLITVCEEAGCPNLSECWADGTATFMVLGERCTRACGFCLVDTSKPVAPVPDEPERVSRAVEQMGLAHAVVTMVARDDLPDGGAAHVAATVAAIRERTPATVVEVLVSDFHGDAAAADVVIAARPDVFNHNLETVSRLQRAVRPSAGYARSLGLLSRARLAGLRVKSGLIVGMGETDEEIFGALADLAGIGVEIVTIGQYLRPTSSHLPVHRWVPPATFDAYREHGERLGIGHVEASPLTRSSYHARQAASH
jgi:lipoic acid synthetase